MVFEERRTGSRSAEAGVVRTAVAAVDFQTSHSAGNLLAAVSVVAFAAVVAYLFA